jgi:hypothetical protein
VYKLGLKFGNIENKSYILINILYVFETWSLALREEYRLRVSENRVLRRIVGPRGGKGTGGWRKLHNEEVHNLYSFSRRRSRAGHVAEMKGK